jgi:PncC family amidohydrolase
MISLPTYKLAEKLIHTAALKKLKIAVAESCTGGMLSCYLTSVPGSSSVLESGFITYSNESKQRILNVRKSTLELYSAISEETALEMLNGLLDIAPINYAVSITGIAGPSGGSIEKPVGLVYIAYGSHDQTNCNTYTFTGERSDVREEACQEAIQLLLKLVINHSVKS